MSANHAGGAASAHHVAPRFAEHLLRGLRMALLLTAFTQILHGMHLRVLSSFDHAFTSAVVSMLHVADDVEERSGNAAADVQLIELGAELRVLAMEAKNPAAEAVRRLDGIRPLDRGALAALLSELAHCLDPGHERSCLKGLPAATAPAVLVLDFDIAPQGDSETDRADARQMIAALKALRAHIDVVAIALDRPDTPSRELRNGFMREAGCTREKTFAPGQGHHLYFASPRLLQRPQEAPLQYLTRLKAAHPSDPDAASFPGLASVAQLALGNRRILPDPGETATQLCEQAHSPGGQLLEDRLALSDPDQPGLLVRELEHEYKTSYFNWPLLKDDRLRFTPLNWREAQPGKAWEEGAIDQLREQGLKAPVLMLAVDGGGGNDKFLTPGALPQAVGGATLHALQLLSLQQPLNEYTWLGALADLLVGALMVLASAALHVHVFHAWQRRYPGLGALAAALAGLLLMFGFSLLSLRLAGHVMSTWNLWINPLYVVLGLAIHTFAEGREAHADLPAELSWRQMATQLLFKPALRPAPQLLDAGLCFWLQWLILAGGAGVLLYSSLAH